MAQSSKQRAEAEVLDLKGKLRQLNKALTSKGVPVAVNAPLVDTIKAVEGLSSEITVSNGADVIYIDRPGMFLGWGMAGFKPKVNVKEDYDKKDLSRTFMLCPKLQQIPKIEGLEGAKDMSYFVYLSPNLNEVTLPDMPEVKSFYHFADGCSHLRNATIGAIPKCSVISLAFKGCDRLITATIGDCPNLHNLIEAFSGCSSLRTVNIGLSSSVAKKTMRMAFFGCSSLETITGIIDLSLNRNYTSDTHKSFDGCSSLEEVRIKGLKANLNLSACQSLSMESIRFLIENAQTVTGQRIDLNRKLLETNEETLRELGNTASAKGWTLNYQ